MTQRIAVVLACTVLLAACGYEGGDRLDNVHKNTVAQGGAPSSGFTLFGGNGGKSTQEQEAGLGVNAYLWRGALETLKFMPLANADPFGGVIITDWWTPPASPTERFKATAYVLSRQLRADGVRVSLFRQTQQSGQWVDAPVDPAKPTELENMVLAKARELRAQASTTQ
jgi:hypothetical protein